MNKFFILCFLVISLIGNESEDVKMLYFKSYDYEHMGNYKEAIKVLAPLIEKYPKGYTLNLRFGWLFYINKNYKNAIKYYKKAISLNQYSLDAKLGLISVYLKTKSFLKTQTLAYEVLKIDYYNYYANIYIIQSLIAEKKYDIATIQTNKMLAIYPTHIPYLELLAVIYKNTKNKYLSNIYEAILILDPNNVLAKSNL